jgi:hypothetical protein
MSKPFSYSPPLPPFAGEMWTREENWKKRQFCPTLLPTACTPLQNPMEKSVTKNKI